MSSLSRDKQQRRVINDHVAAYRRVRRERPPGREETCGAVKHMIQNIRGILRRVVKRGTFLHKVAECTHCFLWQHAPRYFDWKPNRSMIDLDITTRCNLSCHNCSRSIGLAPADESLSIEQLNRFISESIDLHWRWRRIGLVGGEPTLHPQFEDVLEVLASYRKMNPECAVTVVTNGHGKRVQELLSNLPEWIMVESSEKTSNENTFQSYNVAPIDIVKLQHDDFTRACFITEYCGIALTRNGYYCCAPGASLDRVFGFDIGLRSLSSLTDGALREQFTNLCRYCGHYKYNYKEKWVTTQKISPSWQDALDRYKEKKPVLTLY